jgi:trimeric autotransporter adhesin
MLYILRCSQVRSAAVTLAQAVNTLTAGSTARTAVLRSQQQQQQQQESATAAPADSSSSSSTNSSTSSSTTTVSIFDGAAVDGASATVPALLQSSLSALQSALSEELALALSTLAAAEARLAAETAAKSAAAAAAKAAKASAKGDSTSAVPGGEEGLTAEQIAKRREKAEKNAAAKAAKKGGASTASSGSSGSWTGDGTSELVRAVTAAGVTVSDATAAAAVFGLLSPYAVGELLQQQSKDGTSSSATTVSTDDDIAKRLRGQWGTGPSLAGIIAGNIMYIPFSNDTLHSTADTMNCTAPVTCSAV